jgi:hypothetical protein
MGKLEVIVLFGSITDSISFGAVLEEFEVRDSIENVFSTKPEPNMVF